MNLWFRTWYTIVYYTKQSPAVMAGFTGACIAVPYGLYRLSTWATNPEVNAQKVAELRKDYKETLSQQVPRAADGP